MINMSSRFRWNQTGSVANRQKRISLAHAALDSQVMKDTDPYVPFRTGVLAGSPMTNSHVGVINYATPYARRLYYGVGMNFRRAFHPQATHHWLEKSKAIWIKRWTQIVNYILISQKP